MLAIIFITAHTGTVIASSANTEASAPQHLGIIGHILCTHRTHILYTSASLLYTADTVIASSDTYSAHNAST